ncbi:MAG: CGNR zinc finger domain-containing protein [Solirubrobacteraceae bacterium]
MDLPADLVLPLRSGEGWWYWLGGRPALDFVNTFRERWWRQVETLVTPADLSQWTVRAGLVDEPPRFTPALLASARELREAINTALVATLEGRAAPANALDTIDGWLVESRVPDRLVRGDNRQASLEPGYPAHPGRYALGLISRDAAEMLGTDQRDRVRVCASETCSARFYDRSRAGRRRWCSMEGCGNTAKARRHRARQAEASAG